MLDILFWLLLGAFIGWNLPQPPWAVFVENKARELVTKFTAKKDS